MHDEENRACDKNMLIGDDVKCTCGNTVLHNYADGEIQNPEQKEEWEEEYITLLGTLMEISAFSAYLGSFHHGKIKDFIRTQIALAEERGRDAQQKEDYEVAKAQQEKAFKSGAEMGEERGRKQGEADGAKRMTAKVRGVLMLYPPEVQDELSVVLKDYLDELSTLTQKL